MEANAASKTFFRSAFLLKLRGSFASVLPIVAVISIVFFTGIVGDFNLPAYVSFLICSALIVLGLSLFNVGSEASMSAIGKIIGESLFKKRKIFFVVATTFVIGVLVTIAEPDLKVTAAQIGVDEVLLITIIGVGVGLFVVFGVLRIIFNKNLNIMFICFYGLVFMLAGIVNPKFLPICFDSGGVTTGPVTVPFILAFGAGLAASTASGGRSGEDSFGLTALASVGPIIAVMVLSLFLDVDSMVYVWTDNPITAYETFEGFWPAFFSSSGRHFLSELGMVGIAIAPTTLFYLIYDLIFIKSRGVRIVKILINMLYAYFGLVIFLAAVNIGFLPVAQEVGKGLGTSEGTLGIAIIIGAAFGLFGVLAEPAVHVLIHQVEIVSEGTIKSMTVGLVMALSVGGGVALALIRAYYGFSILYYMIPGYIIALGLSFLVPKIYTAMAFDSGGVASGPMASTFVVPFVIGFAYQSNGAQEVFENAFGAIAMIALMPLIVVQGMGLYANIKRSINNYIVRKRFHEDDDLVIISFEEANA